MIPYFNAGIFLENKQQIGKVDEIFGPMKQFVRTKKMKLSCLMIMYFSFLFSGSP